MTRTASAEATTTVGGFDLKSASPQRLEAIEHGHIAGHTPEEPSNPNAFNQGPAALTHIDLLLLLRRRRLPSLLCSTSVAMVFTFALVLVVVVTCSSKRISPGLTRHILSDPEHS
jgi:hypothetical protein